MLRYVLLFLAGVPAGWCMVFAPLTDATSILGCIVVSALVLIAAWQAPDHSKPEKALEKRLKGLRVVGREEER
jgi:hypothetical protein